MLYWTFSPLPFVSGMSSWIWKVGRRWTRNWTLRTVVPLMKVAGAMPDSCCLWGASIQLLRPLHAGELESTPPSTFCAQTKRHMKTHTCAEHPYARQVASALVARGGLPTVLCRTAEIIVVLPDTQRMLILSHIFCCIVVGSSLWMLLLSLSSPFSPLNSGAHQSSDLPPVLVHFLKSLDPRFFLRWRLFYSLRSFLWALPAQRSRSARHWSSHHRKNKNTNQNVIIIITLLEERAARQR